MTVRREFLRADLTRGRRWKVDSVKDELDYFMDNGGITVTPSADVSSSEKTLRPRMGTSGVRCVRITFIVLNILILLGCFAILGVGIWLHIFSVGYTRLVAQYLFFSGAGFCIGMGCVGILLCILGCFGAWAVNRCLLGTYFTLVLLLFLAETGLVIYCLIYRDTLLDNARYALRFGLRANYLPHSSLATTWDAVQETFCCCGVDDLKDWHFISAWPELNIVPDSCCIPEARRMPNCGKSLNFALLYPRGCFPVVRDYIMRNMYIFAIIAIALAFIQVYGLISAMVLLCSERRKKAVSSQVVVVQEEPAFIDEIRVEPVRPYVETNL